MNYYFVTGFERYANDSTFYAEHYLNLSYKLDSQENINKMKEVIYKSNPNITNIVVLNFILLKEN